MTGLERRYRRLLWAYPADYRRDRGDEIVGTYLDLAGPQRRWPSPTDAADLVGGGLRQRLRAAGATDLVPGVRLAALLALATATFLAAFWAVAEQHPPPAEWGVPRFAAFVSVGVVAWFAWLVTAVLALVAPGRPTRVAVAAAVLVTMALPVASMAAGLPRPPLFVLVPQVTLGLLGLAADARPAPPARALPAATAVVGAGTAFYLTGPGSYWGWYGWTGTQLLPAAGGVLLAIALLLAAGRDGRGQWALAALLTPVGLLCVHVLAGAVEALPALLGGDGLGGAPQPTFATLVTAAVAVGLLGPAVLPLGVAVRRRRGAVSADPCPVCGAHRRVESDGRDTGPAVGAA